MTAQRFTIAAHERSSPLWRNLADYYTERLAMLRAQNDIPQDADKTAYKRGQIAECKAILALADELPSA